MTVRVAINGYGRIGQCILRSWIERGLSSALSSALSSSQDSLKNWSQAATDLEIVAINELADADTIGYLTEYDSAHGKFPGDVSIIDQQLQISAGQKQCKIQLLRESNPDQCPWKELNIDLVLECTGTIKTRKAAEAHLKAGAKKVLISNPADSSVDATILYGVNHQRLTGKEEIIANGSCSTNALIPILQVMDQELGIEKGVTTTIHSAMNDQPVIDAYHSDLRRTRAANHSIIPVDTALSKGIDRVLPAMANKIESLHVRVPTLNVSVLDVSLLVNKQTDAATVNELLVKHFKDGFSGVIGYTDAPHASIDFNHDPRSAIIDCTQTRVSDGTLVKLFIWFDNEWGFSNRMLDTSLLLI